MKESVNVTPHVLLMPYSASISKIEGHNWRQCVFSKSILSSFDEVLGLEKYLCSRYVLFSWAVLTTKLLCSGDIEDMLKTIAFIKGHKWTSMMIKRVYFGNWLRDYSQAMDVGSLKGVQAGTVRILVWVLSFLVCRRVRFPD